MEFFLARKFFPMLELSMISMSVLLKNFSVALFINSTLLAYLLLSSIRVIKLENTMCVLGLKDFISFTKCYNRSTISFSDLVDVKSFVPQ